MYKAFGLFVRDYTPDKCLNLAFWGQASNSITMIIRYLERCGDYNGLPQVTSS